MGFIGSIGPTPDTLAEALCVVIGFKGRRHHCVAAHAALVDSKLAHQTDWQRQLHPLHVEC